MRYPLQPALLIGLCLTLPLHAGEPTKVKTKAPPLPPALLVQYQSPADSGNALVLAPVELSRLGKREFLVGRIVLVETATEFMGKQVWIPVDQIIRMVGFDSKEEAVNAVKSGRDREAEREVPPPPPLPLILKNALAEMEEAAGSIHWRLKYNPAREEAAKKGKHLFLVFRLGECPFADQLEESLEGDRSTAAILKNRMVPLKLNMEREGTLAALMGVDRSPTVVLAGPDGRILETLVGQPAPGRVAALLQKALKEKGLPD